jgi:DNA-binding CsgD family transcriptional regulator
VSNIQPKEIYLILIFLIMATAGGVDLIMDFSHGTDMSHVIQEAVVVSLSLVALAWLLRDIRRQGLEIEALRQELSSTQQSAHKPEKYILDARSSLQSVITRQFQDWQLTNSEQEVGRLLLKGLSLKEIAAIRNTLEKTVRQQASSIYRKADLPGRHAFSAWFIEDIL